MQMASKKEVVKFGIWCEVWGGVTGHRTAWLKNIKDSTKVWEFDDETEAQVMAAHYQNSTNSNPHRTANFSYTVRPLTAISQMLEKL
jgi:hypothetical protein